MADEHWGRYKTICISIGVAILGHIILVLSAIPPIITHENSCFAVFMLGAIIMGLGTGGFKPNISPLVVEQIPYLTAIVRTLPTGERVIIDPTITQSRIYHYFYLFINIGALVGQIGMVYGEKYVGFGSRSRSQHLRSSLHQPSCGGDARSTGKHHLLALSSPKLSERPSLL